MRKTYAELYRKVLEFLPNAEFGEDNDGQIVIYTNKQISTEDTENIEDFKEETP